MTIREFMKEKYLDYFNNYLTAERFAADNGVTESHAIDLIASGAFYHELDAEKKDKAP